MLLDRGLLVQEGNVYRLTGPVETLEVPETLHALIAARLDSLTPGGAPARPERRRARQDVHQAGARGAHRPARRRARAAARRRSCARRSSRSRPIRAHPSAASTRSCRTSSSTSPTRRSRRRSARRSTSRPRSSCRRVWSAEEDEIVEVVAAHYLDAYAAGPDDPMPRRSAPTAREMLVRAAERAASLAANAEAQRAFERAIELTDDPRVQAELHERAGMMAQDRCPGGRRSRAFRAGDRALRGGGGHPSRRQGLGAACRDHVGPGTNRAGP